MLTHIILVVSSLVLLHSANAVFDPVTCAQAAEECEFEFVGSPGEVPTFSLGRRNNRAFTDRIVSKDPDELIGICNTRITPQYIRPSGEAVRITLMGTPHLERNHFKPFRLPRRALDGAIVRQRRRYSGIGHQTFIGDQREVAAGLCIRVSFTQYQRFIGPGPRDVRNINVGRKANKCVVFITAP